MPKIRQAARIVLLNPEGKVFLIHVLHPDAFGLESTRRASYWITPGGGIEVGENPEDTVRRELYEETGIKDATIITPHAYYSENVLTYRKEPTLFQEWFFIAHTDKTDISTCNYTEQEKNVLGKCKWWSLSDLQSTKELFFPKNLCDLVAQAIQ